MAKTKSTGSKKQKTVKKYSRNGVEMAESCLLNLPNPNNKAGISEGIYLKFPLRN